MRLLYLIVILLMCEQAGAKKLEAGKGKTFTTLGAALAAAEDGDTVLLYKGVYKEHNLVITKSIRLVGVDNPVLDGEGKYEMLTVSGHDIAVTGIDFQNAGYSSVNDYAAIKVIDATRITLENNSVGNAFFAIHLANTTYSIIRNNKIRGNFQSEQSSGNGIHAWKCENLLVADNHIEGHRDGIYFEFVTHSTIQNNFSTRNIRYGLHFMFSHNDAYLNNTFKDNGAGVAVMYSHKVLMVKNHFDRNWGSSAYGILLKEISDSRIYQNTFFQNTVGILMEGTNRIDVQLNKFISNGWAMKVQASCSDNTFALNNFQGNTFDVATNGATMLNHFGGNYWDKYEGYDINRDKIGDIPYHPVSMYSMVIEQNPNTLMLLRSFMVSLLDKAEKAIPSLTPENLIDEKPSMNPLPL